MNNLENMNWEQFYNPHIHQSKVKQDQLIGLCPFHDDSTPSFSVSLKTGQYKCFACGKEGNAITFLSEKEGIDTKEAYGRLLQEAGHMPLLSQSNKNPNKKTTQDEEVPKIAKSYKVEDYAIEKNLPLAFLKDLHLKNQKSGMSIPYYNEAEEWVRNRIRYAPTGAKRFSWGKGGALIPYGLWKLEKIRKMGYVILVEGESDAQTLWYLGFPALGIPGASTFKSSWCTYLQGLEKIYIYQEPDQGGEQFCHKIRIELERSTYSGEIHTIQSSQAKDISALYQDCSGDKQCGRESVSHLLQESQKVIAEAIPNEKLHYSPIPLYQANGYQVEQTGVWLLDDKQQPLDCLCRTPLVLTCRMVNEESEEEKVELAFNRDGVWKYIIERRSIVFQSKNIMELANYGITITSENAKWVVKYLQELESANFETLERKVCVSHLGWHGKDFVPYGHTGVSLDVCQNAQMWVDGYTCKGNLDIWKYFVNELRKESLIIRAYIAAACATPFLKPMGQRIFYVYNWADTEGGKTACLNLALSVWGDPAKLMQTYNSTSVGLEFMASYMSDLPLGLNERQSAGKDQSKLETDAYRLVEGRGRLRGNQKGGLQNRGEWRTIILANGEEPFITEETMNGISTRTLEIYGAPFTQMQQARDTYELVKDHYGLLGQQLVTKAFAHEDFPKHLSQVVDLKQAIEKTLIDKYPTYKSSNVTAVSFITAVDIWLSLNFLNGGEDKNLVMAQALEMAEMIIGQLATKKSSDIVEKYYQFTLDWINMNKNKFIIKDTIDQVPMGEIYGMIEHAGAETHHYIYPKVFEDFCKREGQSSKKILQGFAERGYIRTRAETDIKRSTLRKWILGKQCRVIQLTVSNRCENDCSENSVQEKMPF